MPTVEPCTLPLSGVTLIEASAGTGKTYTITSLYLRLLLEKNLTPAQILVVTFTEAAAGELKERIRRRLLQALACFSETIPAVSDDFLTTIGGRLPDPALARLRLQHAIHSLDLAAIFTIHGFCHRVLQECAFEGGILFDTELGDEREILQEIIDDYWRLQAPHWSPELAAYLHWHKINSNTLFTETFRLIRLAARTGMEAVQPKPAATIRGDQTLLPALLQLWDKEREQILEALQSGDLSQAKESYSRNNVMTWAAALDHYVLAPAREALPVAALSRFTTEKLQEATKKKKTCPRHLFFNLASRLFSDLAAAHNGLRFELLAFCLKELKTRKNRQKLFTFDDLLTGVRDGLRSPATGERLATLLRKKFPAALIDEFQDTDPVQFEIFRLIYPEPKHGTLLFLIGDPKQAIYSFRGADIFTYLKAVQTAERYTMGTSYRADPLLTRALNELFQLSPNPFLIPELTYHPVQAAGKTEPLLVDDDFRPLTIFHFKQLEGRDEAKFYLACHLAVEIQRLLSRGEQGLARLGAAPLQADHIAVLVRSHKDGEIIRQALEQHGIKAAMFSQETIFSSLEAWDLQLVMHGVVEPWDAARFKTCLATPLLGYSALDLKRLEQDEAAWEALLERFLAYRRAWLEHGFTCMIRHLFRQEMVYERLAGHANTERRLTNLHHLLELLEQQAHHQGAGPAELLTWLQQCRGESRPAADEEQLRLESDERLVKIVTVHKSKGLEYPIVFCPFFWDSAATGRNKDTFTVFHDHQFDLKIDLGSPEFELGRQRQLFEELAEEMRLLYVALTRAKNRCYLYWGPVLSRSRPVNAGSSLGYLLHPETNFADDFLKVRQQLFKTMSPAALLAPLTLLAGRSQEAMCCLSLHEELRPQMERTSGEAVLHEARHLNRQLLPNWQIRSFSALQQAVPDHEAPDYDAAPSLAGSESQAPEAQSIFSFPRGAKAGSFLHSIFEVLNFQNDTPEAIRPLVENRLLRFGFDLSWSNVIVDNVLAVLRTVLAPEFGDLHLAAIVPEKRLNELEFYYTIPNLPTQPLRHLIVREIPGRLSEAGSQREGEPAAGEDFMKGFIDLVFEWQGRYFLADYKSNHLGNSRQDYHGDHLTSAIKAGDYDLQYYIYTVTLHRYLALRLREEYDYDRHFGGVFYLFLRGMSPETGPDCGVFYDRPDKVVIARLDEILGKKRADYRDLEEEP